MLFLVKDSVISEILIYNLGHNILELYNVLVKIQLTTSKMKPDIQYCKFGIRVALGVGERLMLCFMETNLIHAPYAPPPAPIHAGPDNAPGRGDPTNVPPTSPCAPPPNETIYTFQSYFFLFLYILLYIETLIYFIIFTEKICVRHFRRWGSGGGAFMPAQKKYLGSQEIMKYQENLKVG